jgi:hypothetical protein
MNNDRFKFRYWDVHDKKMIYIDKSIPYILPFGAEFEFFPIDEEDMIVMQWTGLKDCEGKDVYEDDIFLWHDGYVKIFFKNGYFCFKKINSDEYYPFWPTAEFIDGSGVIGNIYENQDLLHDNNPK